MHFPHWLSQPAVRTTFGLLAAASWYATQIEPRWLRVQRLTLVLPKLPPAFDGYRIAHFSDQHLGVRGADQMLARAVQIINRESPDLVAMTGDLVTWSRRVRIQVADAAPLADLHAPDGVWSVLGNHDWPNLTFVNTLITSTGGTLLRNQAHVIQRGEDRMALLGLDNVSRGVPDLNAAFATVPANTPAIVMVHEPDFAPAAAAHPSIMLQLSGHTHGGQIVPIPGHAVLLPRYGRTHFYGLTPIHHMWLYITNGTGTGRFVARWNCRPEIAMITLRCARRIKPVL